MNRFTIIKLRLLRRFQMTLVCILICGLCIGQSGSTTEKLNMQIDSILSVNFGNQQLLSYHFKTVYPPAGVDSNYKRSGFIHPLNTLHGQSLTSIQPSDHYHHYGIWNAWTNTLFEKDTIDFWNLNKRKGTVRFVKFTSQINHADFVEFTALHQHIVFQKNGKEKTALQEWFTVRVHKPIQGSNKYTIDITSVMRSASESPLLIMPYRYGGLAWRATPFWDKSNVEMLTSQGNTREDADSTNAKWIIVSGALPKGDEGGMAILSHPSNFNHPEPLRIWDRSQNNGRGDVMVNFAPTRNKAWLIEPGQTYTLKYRLIVFNGKYMQENISGDWQEFSNPPLAVQAKTAFNPDQQNIDTSLYPRLTNFTTQEDHANMMQQLGIQKLRPGKSGNEADPNHANYDESLAGPCPTLPEVLKTNNGKKVIDPKTWWNIRRPEIIETFEKEVYGRAPKVFPKVQWIVDSWNESFIGNTPIIVKQLRGKVNNHAYPLIDVQINMILVLPGNVKAPVPVLMMFGNPKLPASTIYPEEKASLAFGDGTPTEQLLAAGWGYCIIDPRSIQADQGAGLTRGIIGLVNKGQSRHPDDWGALRAWAWGASRALDFLETEKMVNAKNVGIEGVSRYGKAALVTLAFDQRFAIGLIGSSGKGGVTLHRRVFGETVENLAGSGEYHWMAGNYLKYATAESVFGTKTGCDLPVDAHQLIALCAPRPVFISYGIPEKGDAKWLDQTGSYRATIAAGTVYKLMGVKDLGRSNDYMQEKMPPALTSLLDGQLAWRQHEGGHTDAPNFQYFIPWANRMLK